jgi:hypothetical protein
MLRILEVSKPYPGSNPSDAADQGGPEEAKGSAAPDGAQARVRWATDAQLLKGRAAVTTGSRLLEGGDGRGPWARRMRDLIELHISDLGGIDAASEAERSIIRRAATLTIELERLEAKFSTLPNGPRDSDLDMYQRCSNSLRRLLETIGIKRVPRDITPSLEGYLDKLKPDIPSGEMD